MGINDLEVEQITCGAKILYYADACEKFSEHELDYILFAKLATETPSYEINSDEVKNTAWVARSELDDFLAERESKYGEGITPWFKLLKARKLDSWWRDIERDGKYPAQADYLEKFY